MASVAGNTWRFYPADVTSGAVVVVGSGATKMALNFDIHAAQLAWSGLNTGDTLEVLDGAGNSVFPVGNAVGTPFTATANTPNPLYLQPGQMIVMRQGIQIPTMSGGVLSITVP